MSIREEHRKDEWRASEEVRRMAERRRNARQMRRDWREVLAEVGLSPLSLLVVLAFAVLAAAKA